MSKNKQHVIDMTEMKAILPGEWAARILTLPARVRAEVAKVVWWDFFAHRMVSERWGHLDRYLAYCPTPPELDKFQLRDRLVEIGYRHDFASRRCGIKLKQPEANV
jgi:hypothetical protein